MDTTSRAAPATKQHTATATAPTASIGPDVDRHRPARLNRTLLLVVGVVLLAAGGFVLATASGLPGLVDPATLPVADAPSLPSWATLAQHLDSQAQPPGTAAQIGPIGTGPQDRTAMSAGAESRK